MGLTASGAQSKLFFFHFFLSSFTSARERCLVLLVAQSPSELPWTHLMSFLHPVLHPADPGQSQRAILLFELINTIIQ